MVKTVVIAKCDRCDAEEPFEIDVYPLPEKWLKVCGCGDLCPQCAHLFKAFVMDFFDGNVPAEWKLPRCY